MSGIGVRYAEAVMPKQVDNRIECSISGQQDIRTRESSYRMYKQIDKLCSRGETHARRIGKQTRQHQDGPRTRECSLHMLSQHPALILVSISLVILAYSVAATEGVDCFKCSSRNGSNPACEDPFHNLNTTRVTSPILPDPPPNVIYHAPCYAGRKGRDGLFLASTCIKLTGTFDATGEKLVVRHCALDSGTLTQDTELARMSHCGKFQFDGDSLQGCVLACPEDACNSALPNTLLSQQMNIILTLTLALSLLSFIIS